MKNYIKPRIRKMYMCIFCIVVMLSGSIGDYSLYSCNAKIQVPISEESTGKEGINTEVPETILAGKRISKPTVSQSIRGNMEQQTMKTQSENTANDDPYITNSGKLVFDPEDKNTYGNSDYQQIQDLLMNDANIAFDPDTQTFVVVEIEATRSANAKRLLEKGILTEESLSAAMVASGFTYLSSVYINGVAMPINAKFYIYDGAALSEGQFTNSYPDPTAPMVDNGVGLNIFIIDKGDTCSIVPDPQNLYRGTDDEYGDGYLLPGSNIYAAPNPVSEDDLVGYEESDIKNPRGIHFSFEWEIYRWLELETWFIDRETKTDAFSSENCPDGTFSTIDYLFELRDEDKNITLLPPTIQEKYDYIDYRDWYTITTPGIVTHHAELNSDTYWTESGIRIPAGYDLRITAIDNDQPIGVNFSAYEDVFETATFDKEGFYLTANDFAAKDSIVSEYFIIPTETIRVEKIVEGEETDKDFDFVATKSYHTVKWEEGYTYKKFDNIVHPLKNYPYLLCDTETDERIGKFKTSTEGEFSLKNGQYALFPTWKIPDDYADYTYPFGGIGLYQEAFKYYEGIGDPLPESSVYTFEEINTNGYETRVDHIQSGVSKRIEGTLAEDVHNNDNVVFTNTVSPQNGNLAIEKTVSGKGADKEKAFTFTVTLNNENIGGIYGDMTFEKGIATFTLKNGERKTAMGLPAGVTYTVAESDNAGYTVTVNGIDMTTATGKIPVGGSATAAFNNHKSDGGIDTKPSYDSDEPKPDNPPPSNPIDKVPRTGDTGNIGLWIALVCLFAVVLLMAAFNNKRLNRHRG